MLQNISGADSLAFGKFCDTYVHHKKLTASVLREYFNKSEYGSTELIISETREFVNDTLAKRYLEPRDVQYMIASLIHQFLYGRGEQDEAKKQLELVISNLERFNELAGNGNPFDVMPWLCNILPGSVKAVNDLLLEAHVLRDTVINEHLETYSTASIRDLNDLLIKTGRETAGSDTEEYCPKPECLRAILGDLHGAAFDTTNKMIQRLLLYMAVFPDVQSRVQTEIDDVVGDGRSVEITDRRRLVFTDATIHEVMRCVPNIPFALPHYTTNDTKVSGYDIDIGTVVIFNLHSVMNEKSYWGDPDVFRPSRLIDECGVLDKKKCNHIIPFGMGRRKCVGEHVARLEIFLMFTTIIQRCSVSVPIDQSVDLQPIPGLTYSPKPFRLIVSER